jgi:NADP-dependent 3-hydroxy acid dehydrogenase YdfG
VGDIDILLNNAGFAVWGPAKTFEIASFAEGGIGLGSSPW